MVTQIAGSLNPEGPVAATTADLWWLMLGLGTAVFAVVLGLLIVALVRRPPDDAGADPSAESASNRLKGGGTLRWIVGGGVAMPLVILLVVLGATVGAMRDIPRTAPPGALRVQIIGHQFWWEVRYPEEGVVTANEVHIPTGRPVAFDLTSADVIHSFWVPALGGKMDLLPDGVNTLVLQADEPGRHSSLCAEFCGVQHTNMGLLVVAEPPAQFDSWIAEQDRPAAEPTNAAAQQGREVFLAVGCATCHAVRGTSADGDLGPDLTHFASRPTLGAGVAPNTTQILTGWVADPHALKNGVEMPAADLPGEQLDAVVAYLESLR